MVYLVLARKKGSRRSKLFGSLNGRRCLVDKRLHAIQYGDQAQAERIAKRLGEDNPDYAFSVKEVA